MCLDPRPDSLFRVRRPAVPPRVTRKRSAAAAATADRTPATGTSERRYDAWTPAVGDELALRGWTLVTRAIAAC